MQKYSKIYIKIDGKKKSKLHQTKPSTNLRGQNKISNPKAHQSSKFKIKSVPWLAHARHRAGAPFPLSGLLAIRLPSKQNLRLALLQPKEFLHITPKPGTQTPFQFPPERRLSTKKLNGRLKKESKEFWKKKVGLKTVAFSKGDL